MMGRRNLVFMFLVALGVSSLAFAGPPSQGHLHSPQKAKTAVRTPAKAQTTKRKPSSKKPINVQAKEPIRYDLDISQDGRQIVLRESRSQIQQSYYVELKRGKRTLGIVSLDQNLFKKYASEMESLSAMKTKGSCSRGLRLKKTQSRNIKTTRFCEGDLSKSEQARLKKVTSDFAALVGTSTAQRDAKR